jgi:hypothetical protein
MGECFGCCVDSLIESSDSQNEEIEVMMTYFEPLQGRQIRVQVKLPYKGEIHDREQI